MKLKDQLISKIAEMRQSHSLQEADAWAKMWYYIALTMFLIGWSIIQEMQNEPFASGFAFGLATWPIWRAGKAAYESAKLHKAGQKASMTLQK